MSENYNKNWMFAARIKGREFPEGYMSTLVRRHGWEDTVFIAVAVPGAVGDWAAYAGLRMAMETPEYIAATGDKMGETEARVLFPQMKDFIYRN